MNRLKKLAAVVLSAALIVSCMFIGYATAEENTQLRYYCGFEDYTEQISGISLDSSVAAIVTDSGYVGDKALKLTLPDNGITAFELRDSTPFDIVAGKEYTVSFAYKTYANAELSVGVAQAGNVTETAEALSSCDGTASEEWQTASVTVTPNKSTSDGYALSMLVFAETAAEVYLDDIAITYYSQGAVTLDEINFSYTSDTFPTFKAFTDKEETELQIWDGDATTEPKDSDGDGVYEITNGAELAHVIKISAGGGLSYILTNDIYLNDISKIDWTTGEIEDEYSVRTWYSSYGNTDFSGTIDGNGYGIYGLYLDQGNTSYTQYSRAYGTGLIPQTSSSTSTTVKNLYMDYVYLHYNSAAAPFIGSVRNSTISSPNVVMSNCYAGENITVDAAYSGGLIGLSGSTNNSSATVSVTIENCASLANLKYAYSYGLTTSHYNSGCAVISISNSFNAKGPVMGYVRSTAYIKATVTDCYETSASSSKITSGLTVLIAENMQGSDVLTNTDKMSGLSSDTYVATSEYPILTLFAENLGINKVWDGKTKTPPADSDGDGVFEITKGEELAYIIYNHGTMVTGTETTTDEETGEEVITDITKEACSFILTDDIYLNDITKINWSTGDVAIGYTPNSWFLNTYFAGNIDGDGHTVYGLYYSATALNKKQWSIYGVGLVPRVLWGDTVSITDLGMDNVYINSDTGASAFVGCGGTKNDSTNTAYANIAIERCYAGENITLTGYSAGVFRGAGQKANASITDCYSLATTNNTSGDNSNSFIGMTSSCTTTIDGCFNANGTLATAGATITDSYQTVAGKLTTVTDVSNMKGDDVLTDENKMPLLDSEVFTTSTQSFSEYDFYVYLPAGTAFSENVEAKYYNDFFLQLDESTVISDGVMLKGAYVKFSTEPDETKITLPAELKVLVRYGSMEELLITNPYYGVKMDIITDAISDDSSSVKYVFITDIHYIGSEDVERSVATIKQIENLVEYVNKTDSIDFVAVGGDTIQGTQKKSTSLGYFKKAFTPFLDCNKPVVIVPGNHDDNSYAYNKTSFDGSWLITDKDWNDNIIDVYVNREISDGDTVTVSQDEAVENSKYFYYDLEAKKTRIICLDAIDYEQSYDENGTLTVDEEGNVSLTVRDDSKAVTNYLRYYMATTYWGYGARQMEWLAEEALQAGEDWDYIFISHMGIDEATNFNEGAEITHYGKNLREIITAYQFKTPYVNEELGINADFSETSGRILSYQYGHTHSQKNLYSEDVDLWQINSATAQVRDGYFDVMTVSDKKIGRYNIGRGYDETFIQTQSAVSGDVTQDKSVDICDLVKLNLVANGTDNRTTAADIDNNGKIEIITDAAALRKLIIK